MILVTVGTERYPFNSLMDWVEVLIEYGIIDKNEEVIVQYGSSTKIPDGVKVFQLLPESVFKNLVDRARVVVAHCGEGTAMMLESAGKPFVLVPRTRRFGEHVDDHQLEMADALEQRGVAVARSPGDLVKFLSEPSVSIADTNEDEVSEALSGLYNGERHKKLMLVCSSGGHFKAMRHLEPFWKQFEKVSWVTFKTKTTETELKDKGEIHWAYSPTNRNIPNLIRNLRLAFKVLLSAEEKPDLVVSTGAGVAVPFLLIAKYLCKSEVVFVESKTRLRQLSLSARILHVLSALDKLIVQGEELARQYPEAIYVKPESVTTNSIETKATNFQPTILSERETVILRTPTRLNGLGVKEFQNSYKTAFDKSPKKVVLDMSHTKSIDSVGLATLFTCQKVARAIGCELVLWSVGLEVRFSLSIAGVEDVFNIETLTTTARTQGNLGRYPSITLHPSVRNPIKRAFDIVGASLGLGMTALLFIPIWIAIALDSPGPIFMTETRCGLMGKPFNIRKFRATLTKAEVLNHQVQNPTSTHLVETESDATVTRFGRFLRKTGLEQLPMLWNVLKGEMSLIGPQPPTPEQLKRYTIPEWSRLNVKPGIVNIPTAVTGQEKVSHPSMMDNVKQVLQEVKEVIAHTWSRIKDWNSTPNPKNASMSQQTNDG